MTISEKEKAAMIRHLRRFRNVSLTSRLFGRSRTTVVAIKHNKHSVRAPGPRPERIRRARKAKEIAKRTKTIKHRTMPMFPSSASIAEQLQKETGIRVSARQIRSDLKLVKGRSRVRPKVPTREAKDISARRSWCRRNLKVPFKRWCFSDETWVTTNEQTCRTCWVFDGEQPLPREFKSRFNIPSCQVWFAFGWDWKSPVVVFPAKMNCDGEVKAFRLSADSYVRRCLSVVSAHFSNTDKILVQDGARSHVARTVRQYALRKGMNLTFDWPPYSPVLNVAEEVNSIFKQRVAELVPTTLEELVCACHKAWADLPQSILNAFVKSFQDKMKKHGK
jgi:hypothetical protein